MNDEREHPGPACLNLLERITRRYDPKGSEHLRLAALTEAERTRLFASGQLAMRPVVPEEKKPKKRYAYKLHGKFKPLNARVTQAVHLLLRMEKVPHGYITKLAKSMGIKRTTLQTRYRAFSISRAPVKAS